MRIVINNKPYEIFCGEGEENQVSVAACNFNERIKNIKKVAPNANQEMLIMMTALMLQDEYDELSKQKNDPNEEIADALESISGYIEKLSSGLK